MTASTTRTLRTVRVAEAMVDKIIARGPDELALPLAQAARAARVRINGRGRQLTFEIDRHLAEQVALYLADKLTAPRPGLRASRLRIARAHGAFSDAAR